MTGGQPTTDGHPTGGHDAVSLARFRSLLGERLGWSFDDGDTGQLSAALAHRCARLGLGPAAYLSRLAGEPWQSETTALAEHLSITETHFFRYTDQFRALAETALPERLRARRDRRLLRLLSVGCSTGEEAYTLAISAREAQPDQDWDIRVLGVDANPVVLRRAAAARYSEWSLRETPEVVRRRWFRPVGDGFEVDPAIRQTVQLRQHNVADEDPTLWQAAQYDIVFCRNLLMYLTRATAAELVRRMTRALAPGGFLFLGHTDTLGSRPHGLDLRHSHQTFYYCRSTDPSTPPLGATTPPGATPPATATAGSTTWSSTTPGAATPGAATMSSATLAVVDATASAERLSGLTEAPPAAATTTPAVRAAVEAPQPPAAAALEPRRVLALLRAERFAEALALVEAHPADDPPPGERLLHGVVLAQTGRLAAAQATARRLLDADGMNADAHQLLALCLDGGGDSGQAVAHYQLAAYLDSGFAMPRLRLGLLARRRDDHRTAVAELETALPLLGSESDERIVLFGGGFGRNALIGLCRAELDACGVHR